MSTPPVNDPLSSKSPENQVNTLPGRNGVESGDTACRTNFLALKVLVHPGNRYLLIEE